MAELCFQQYLSPRLKTIVGSADARERRKLLQRIDEILTKSGLEKEFVEACLREAEAGGETSPHRLQSIQKHALRAIRCSLLRMLLGEELRSMAIRLAESDLLQWFCRIDAMDTVFVPSKSTLHRYEQMMGTETLKKLHWMLLRFTSGEKALSDIGLEQPLDLDRFFVDSTCLPANIHFPVDWLLLRDAASTLLSAIALIRRHGLKHRMQAPAVFMRRMNVLCMQMSNTRRKAQSNKQRKMILRRMKKLTRLIRSHAQRYCALLREHWAETDWTEAQARQVLRRMDNVLQQLPAAVRQAHERIIAERVVENSEKILSLYEPEIHVVVRGKAKAEVEFGNKIQLCEQAQGVIVDFEFFKKKVPADTEWLPTLTERIREQLAENLPTEEFKISLAADRGYDSAKNQCHLKRIKWVDAIAAKNPLRLRDQINDKRVAQEQKRRAQTEGRIGIMRLNFFGDPLPVKGFENRQLRVCWAVLAHNLWVIARLPIAKTKAKKKAA